MFKAIARAFRNLGDDIARESAEWKMRCTVCGREKSLLAAGGIRYKAAGEKHTLGFCSRCGALRMLKIYRPAKSPVSPSA
ncbi:MULTISPECIES: hypothetical protein [unclassified Caulobacter]|uniref:hypothetical protein n=1 Tax=unclassified Caulobacter TaxID=2648921 RepID=UPI0004A6EE8F|nr:hypothetical protein [Caulobacter sp. UNC358MFTsu5.1]